MIEDNSSSEEKSFENATQMADLSHSETECVIPPLDERLDYLQAMANDGRGISCVKTLISFLRSGDREAADATARNEWDKISSYPDIAQLLIDEGIYTPVDFSTYRDVDL